MAKSALSCAIPSYVADALRAYVHRTPGVTMSGVAEAAVTKWVVLIEADPFELDHPDLGLIQKAAGDPYPERLSSKSRQGRPMRGEAKSRHGRWEQLKLYLPQALAERVRNAAWWRRSYPAWDVGNALKAHLELGDEPPVEETVLKQPSV